MKKYIEIKRWDNQEVIHSGYFISIKECLEDGLSKRISFYRADLGEPYLTVADLSRTDISREDVKGVNFKREDLKGANLLLTNPIRTAFEGADFIVADLQGLYS